jgi:heme-degrading monooxygenase HmoA
MVRFINLFEVPVGQDEQFLAFWRSVNVYMQAKPGYLGHRLHRALADDARYRYVNYVEWDSVEAWRDAHDEGFRALAGAIADLPFTSTPALFEAVDEAGALTRFGDAVLSERVPA